MNPNNNTSGDVPPYLTLLGSAATNATVSLWANNGSFASTYRRNDFFRGELNFNNSTGSLWLTITNVGVLRNGTNADIATNVIGSTFIPQTVETFGYDPDGNMTNDGRWAISWDAENRVTNFSRRPGVAGSNLSIACESDYMGRRISKAVSVNGLLSDSSKFICDGWNLMAILDGEGDLLYSFTWGADASGTIQRAGGVGGLISMTVHSGPNAGTYFYCYDGNFNVVALVKAVDGTIAAQYEYSPFGEVLQAIGPMAQVNPFLFSTKIQDPATGFYDYGHRIFSPQLGRWLTIDPTEEREGEESLILFARNNPVCGFDPLGLATLKFSSDGEVYFDPVWRYFCYDREHDSSGKGNTPDSYMWQSASEIGDCPGGICNSGGINESSSFIHAEVKNVCDKPQAVTCVCTVNYSVANWSLTKSRGVLVSGEVLGSAVNHFYGQWKAPGDTFFSASGSDSITRYAGFTLSPGQSKVLYHAFDVTASPPNELGAGFLESFSGTCSCTSSN